MEATNYFEELCRRQKCKFNTANNKILPIVVAMRSNTCIYGRSLTGIVGSNPTNGMDVSSVVSVVCCQVEVSVTG